MKAFLKYSTHKNGMNTLLASAPLSMLIYRMHWQNQQILSKTNSKQRSIKTDLGKSQLKNAQSVAEMQIPYSLTIYTICKAILTKYISLQKKQTNCEVPGMFIAELNT